MGPGRKGGGGFHFCTSWLIEAYRLAGRYDDAEELFQSRLALAGPTGQFAEEWCPKLERALGHHPQAYTHLGIIKNALALNGIPARSKALV